MKLMIHTLTIELTPTIQRHVENKCVALGRFLDPKHAGLAELRVEVGKTTHHHHKGNVFYAEANLKVGKDLFRASATHEDLHAAINDMKDDIERQLRKHKTKHESVRKTIR